MKTRATLLAAAALAATPLAASADIYYSNDFQTGSTWPELSRNETAENAAYTRFLGRFMNNEVMLTLTLPELPPPPLPADGELPGGDGGGGGDPPDPVYWVYLLSFDFCVIDSWDGYAVHGPDLFTVRVNGSTLLSETFANQHEYQSYPGTPDLGIAQLGFSPAYMDSMYRISLPFLVPAGSTVISFEATGLVGALSDESWGIDNIEVSSVLAPAPGAGGLMLGAAGLAAGRRRRQR